jgi:anti-anti-sigma factor
MFESTFDEATKTLKCIFVGRMDGLKTKEIEDVLSQKMSEASEYKPDLKVIFELGGVSYIASAFIRVCLATAKELSEGNFSITNTDPLIKKTFKIAGLDTILNVK